NTVDMSRQTMYNFYFPPFKAAVDAGVGSVMASFNEVDGIPATANHWLMTEVLRNQWGFNGFIVTDYTGINEMIEHGMGDLQTVSTLALKAGIDMDMVGEGFLTTLGKSLKEGKVTEKEIDQACRRVLEAKFKLGLFEHPYQYCDVKRAEKEVFTPENRQQACAIAAESFVLLKNESQLLPLKKDQKIALIGPLGNNRLNMAGTWSVATDFDQAISVLDGMQAVAGKPELITWAKGSNIVRDSALEARVSIFGKDTYRDKRSDAEMISEAVALALKSDVVVAAVGEAAEMSGESSSRADIGMPDVQQELLRALVGTGKPVVVVLFTGRPLTLTWEDANIPAILNVWFAGTEAGTAIADVLYGDAVPSGKLTTSFPRMVGQIPVYYNHKNTGRPLAEGAWFSKFRSNYLDVPNDPLYPFGYGLSYTQFEYSDLKISNSSMQPTGTITVQVSLKNTGNYDGMEVVQLYIRDRVGSITRPVKELKDFKKVAVKKGQQALVEFTIDIEYLKFYNSNLEFVAEPGAFTVFVGGNSRDVLQADFQLIE
ncbi:MAG TPA: beta-glucosidase, partial [Bacteroidales bacterium]|nr:beta-glucosidase [Bacteroidales bacterium]